MNFRLILGSSRKFLAQRVVIGALSILAIASLGSYFLMTSNAQAPVPAADVTSVKLLNPEPLGFAPYQYISYASSLEQTRLSSGTKQFFAAFIISDGTCRPTWGGTALSGLDSQRAAEIAADITAVRAAGGEVAVSFGGASGHDLAVSCQSVAELQAAYQQVIDKYSLSRLDFDIESVTLNDTAASERRAAALAGLQQINPNLKIWITLPVHTKGVTDAGVGVLNGLIDQNVMLSGINIMAMNYNANVKNMGQQAITNSQETYRQLRRLYPGNQPDVIWKTLGVIVMIGHNDTLPETFSLADAKQLGKFAKSQGIGLLSMWSIGRDAACSPNAPVAVSTSCSGVTQQPYDYTKVLTLR